MKRRNWRHSNNAIISVFRSENIDELHRHYIRWQRIHSPRMTVFVRLDETRHRLPAITLCPDNANLKYAGSVRLLTWEQFEGIV